MAVKQGKDVVLAYRLLADKDSANGKILAYQTEHTFNMSRSDDTTTTKDGVKHKVGEIEYDFTSTALYQRGSATIKMLYQAFMDKAPIEVWVIDREDEQADSTSKFAAKYVQATIINYEETATAEDDVELSLTYAVDLVHQDGYATLTKEDLETASAQYKFVDTVPSA